MAAMKIILRSDVDNLGRLGDIVAVKPGYARNYLIPQGFAVLATDGNQRQFELERRKLQAKADAARAGAQDMADRLANTKVELVVRVGEGDRLYGSVTSANIAEALKDMGIDLDKRKLVLEAPIRALGAYEVPVKLHPDVQATLAVSVIRHGRSAEEIEAEMAAEAAGSAEAVAEDAEALEAAPEAEAVAEATEDSASETAEETSTE
jgi:large subunit ribosomal protein L9